VTDAAGEHAAGPGPQSAPRAGGVPASARLVPFEPRGWLANRHVQSILPSLPLRRPLIARRVEKLLSASRELVVDCGEDVRLLAFAATQDSVGRGPARGAVVLHHGWEGSSESLYILSLGQVLLEAGFDVFRLNLRDHGPSHHLNPGLFHSCRIAEVVGAVRQIRALTNDMPLSLVGFSLGGNFALRVGARAGAAGLDLHRIVAICPVLDPAVTLEALERGPALYREYFMLKWRRSLRRKQAAWPDRYDFGGLAAERSLTTMTARMVAEHTDFPGLDAYLAGYAITGEALAPLATPSRIITSLDDPMIPPHELDLLAGTPTLKVTVTRRGGHCGFVDRLAGGPGWIDREVLSELTRP
jgi:predicted alpha/beta-fold hydrolase